MRGEMEANASSLEEIRRVLRRLPYEGADVSFMADVMRQWTNAGRAVGLVTSSDWAALV